MTLFSRTTPKTIDIAADETSAQRQKAGAAGTTAPPVSAEPYLQVM
jgi:hypothetical protein